MNVNPIVDYSDFLNENRILVGSAALNHQSFRNKFRDQKFRESKDIDYFLRGEEKKFFAKCGNKRIDAHGISPELFDSLCSSSKSGPLISSSKATVLLANTESLYTLKVSHATFDIHWEKTMWDINWFQEHKVELDEDLHNKLYNFWLKVHRHNKDKVNLNRTNEDFFTDGVKRTYIHDDLHDAIKYNDRPMYQLLKHDQHKAMIAKDLFDSSSLERKYQLCREEIYVTALERFYIPTGGKLNSVMCYRRAIKKLVTSMTKGWFPHFIITHFKDLKKPDKDYIADFEKELNAGRIRNI